MIRAVALVATVALAACGSTADVEPAAPSSIPADATSATVVAVLDGDSLVLRIEGTDREARLIGINAPERDECWGPEARERLTDLADGEPVAVATDVEAVDQYDRLLVYVWTSDGTLLNERLAALGDVVARGFPPNTTLQSAIDAAGIRARTEAAGLWGGCASALGGVELDAIQPDPPGPDEDVLIDEWVSFRATADSDLSGWTLRDGSTANRYVIPDGTRLEAGATLTIRTGCGIDTDHDLHWCSDTPVWNNGGDEIILADADGRFVVTEAYGG